MTKEDKEKQLLLVLQALVRAARKNRGVITQSQLNEALDGLELNEEQMQLVRDYLSQNDIGIDVPLDADLRMSQEEKDYLEIYRQAVAAIEQPTPGEMEALKIRAMAGDKQSQRDLSEVLLPIVIDIARLYAGQGVYMEDLIGTGNEALVRGTMLLSCLEGPEEVEGALAQRIMNAMEDLIAENLDAFSVDQSAVEEANLVQDKAQELSEMLGRKVTPEELAAEGELTLEKILRAVKNTGNHIDAIEYKDE